MNVTRVRVRPLNNPSKPRLLAVASVCFDDEFVVTDLRLVRLPAGNLIVAMPSTMARVSCHRCRESQPWSHRYCRSCGARMAGVSPAGKPLFRDSAFPCTHEARVALEAAVLGAYREEMGVGAVEGAVA
jgi:DNA-binding cell septation regulator SpoVG